MGFPSSPSDEDIYTNANGTRYQYDDVDNKWVVIGGAYNLDALTVNTLNATEVNSTDVNTTDLDVSNAINGAVYICSTQADIEAAITDIGTGGGTIIITAGTITLSGAIDLDGGGSYIIQGQGKDTVLKCDTNSYGIYVTSAVYTLITNLSIDTTNNGTTATYWGIYTFNQPNIHVQNCYFYGTANDGLGVYLQGDDSSIINCEFYELYSRAIAIGGDRARVIGNNIHHCQGGASSNYLIYLDTAHTVCSDNIMDTCDCSGSALYGIYTGATVYYTTISNNSIYNLDGPVVVGILVGGIYNTCNGNVIRGLTASTGGCVAIQVNQGHCSIVGNHIGAISTSDADEDAYGVSIESAASYVIFTGNCITQVIAGATSGMGAGIYYRGYTHIINGNITQGISGFTSYSIFHGGGSTSNCIVGNNWCGETISVDSGSSTIANNEPGT